MSEPQNWAGGQPPVPGDPRGQFSGAGPQPYAGNPCPDQPPANPYAWSRDPDDRGTLNAPQLNPYLVQPAPLRQHSSGNSAAKVIVFVIVGFVGVMLVSVIGVMFLVLSSLPR